MGAEGRGAPVCTVIGGPNGSGKSTLYAGLGLPGRFVNADIQARGLNPARPEAASLPAGRLTLAELGRALRARESFVYETTLSSHQSIGLMREVRSAGYEVGLVFVALNSPALNVQRVADRVARGGHDIPVEAILRRYEGSLRRLPDAIGLANGTMVFDNSFAAGARLLLRIEDGRIGLNRLDPADPFHLRLARAVGQALSLPEAAVVTGGR